MQSRLLENLLTSINDRFGEGYSEYQRYQGNPMGFCEDILNEHFTDDVKKIIESVRDNPVTLVQSANAVGKTFCASRIGTWFYKCFPDSQVYVTSAPPESNLKKLLWGEIASITEKHPGLFVRDTINVLQIQRSARSFLSGVLIPTSGSESQREAKFSGKHAPHLLFILDEADAIPDEVYRGIESCMSGGHARLLILLNPRAEAGEAYRMGRDGKANVIKLSAFDHPNVITGNDVISGAVTRETVVRRINEWCRPLISDEPINEECFELPSFLVSAVALSRSGTSYPPLKAGFYKIMEPAFSYMVLGEYPAKGSNQLISREWIMRARERWDNYVKENGERPPMHTPAIAGLDVSELGNDSNVMCFRYGGYVERLTTWGGVDTLITADKATAEYKKRDISRCNIDGTGIGTGIAPQMRKSGISANPVKVASSPTNKSELGEFLILRDQLWWACREWLRTDPGAMLPPDEMLIEELTVPTYEVDKGKIRIMKKDTMRELLKRSPDRADALCLTFYQGGVFSTCDLS